MKTIEIHVPSDFELDPWWNSATSDVVVQALKLVPELVRGSSVAPDVLKRIKELEIQLMGSRETAVHAASAACEQVTKACATTIEEKGRMCELLREENKTYKDMLQQMQTDGRLKDERHSAEISQITKNIQQTPNFISAQQAGSIAEMDVEAVIADCDVSRIEGRGDRFITTPGGLKLLQETKAVEKLHSKHDIEKFKRDVHDGIVNTRINAAIMISVKSQTIPNHGPGPCCIYFNHGPGGRVPVIMIATNNRTTIQLAIQTVAWLQDLCQKEYAARGNALTSETEQAEKERDFLQEHLPKLIESVQMSECDLNTRIDMLKTLLEAAERARVQHSDLRFLILKMQQHIPWLISKTDTAIIIAEKIVSGYLEQKGEYPKSSQLTLAQRAAVKNAGGIKVILEKLKKRKRSEDVPDDDVDE